MTPFHEIKKAPAMKAIGWRGDLSLWNVDTALSRLYDRVLERRLLVKEPAVGIRHDGLRVPDAFHADYEILFPLMVEPAGDVRPEEVRELPEADVATFVHRGPYPWIRCTYEKVLNWLRENGYEVAGSPREIFFVAPEPHSGGTQDDLLTEIQVPVLLRAPRTQPGESFAREGRKAA